MKSLLFILPFLGSLALAQATGDCQAEPLLCSKLHPVTCACQNAMALNQYKACGGIKPRSKDCSAPKPRQAEETCECDLGFCAMSWPESCYCKNAAAEACFRKCGGDEPKLTICPPLTTPSMSTIVQPQQTDTAQVCGGGRGSSLPQCAEGFVCEKDPRTPGCGPDCDGFGICVPQKDTPKVCGGGRGSTLRCDEGFVCARDPSKPGCGTDCDGMGICVPQTSN